MLIPRKLISLTLWRLRRAGSIPPGHPSSLSKIPRQHQTIPSDLALGGKRHLAGQPAGTDFFNTHARRNAQKCFRFRWERIGVGSAFVKMREKVCLKLWVKLGCSP